MKAINNDAVVDALCASCGCKAFAPSVGFAVTPGTSTVAFTQSTVFDAGDSFKKVLVSVYDKQGKQKHSEITAAGGTATLVCTGFDFAGLSLKATVISTGGCKADLAQREVGTTALTGNLGSINEQGDNNEAGNN
jgi:hypothetical protein